MVIAAAITSAFALRSWQQSKMKVCAFFRYSTSSLRFLRGGKDSTSSSVSVWSCTRVSFELPPYLKASGLTIFPRQRSLLSPS